MNIFAHHYHHRYHLRFPRHAKKIFIFDMALITTIFILGALTVFYFLLKPTPEAIDLSLSTKSEKIIAGTENTWELQLVNKKNEQLKDITTTFTFPETFKIISPNEFSPQSPSERIWHIDELSNNATALLDIRGKILSRAGENIKIIARTEGTTKNKTNFSTTRIFTVHATDPALYSTLQLQKETLAGATFPITITYKNQSASELSRPVLRFEIPSSLTISNKPSSWQNQSITLPTLDGGEQGTINLTGNLTADPATSNISIALHTTAKFENNQNVDQEDILSTINVQPTGVKIALKNLETVATPGAPFHVTASFKNIGTQSFEDVSLCLPINSHLVVMESLKGNGKLINNEYCFNSNTNSELAQITPGFSAEWPISFNLQPSLNPTDLEITKNAVLTIFAYTHFTLTKGSMPTELNVRSPEIRIPVTTNLNIQAMGRYFTNEGDQLGRGPIPPQINKTTKYWIAWALNSSVNAIKNVLVSATLPEFVQWTGKSSVDKGKSMKFDPITRSVTWDTDLIEPTAENCACAEGGFEVSITPSENDLNTTPQLLTNIKINAIDAWTNAPVDAKTSNITTDLTLDPFAKGKGKVGK